MRRLPTRAGSPKASDPERLGDCFRTGDSRRLKPCFAGAAGVVCRWSGKRSLALGVDLWDKEKEKGAREKASPQPLPPLFLNGAVNTQNKIVDANFRVAFLLSYTLLTRFSPFGSLAFMWKTQAHITTFSHLNFFPVIWEAPFFQNYIV